MKYSHEQVKQILKTHLEIESIETAGSGNHCEAFCVNNDMIVKLPKHKKASDCLKTKIKVLQKLNNKFDVEIPNILYVGEFKINNNLYTYFISKKLLGKKLTKEKFINLPKATLQINSKIIAKFLHSLHNQRQILSIKRRDLFLLHGDFSLNHVLFDKNNIVCGILDFGDIRVGKYLSDFIYLLDDSDDDEFGTNFGLMVLNEYNKYI